MGLELPFAIATILMIIILYVVVSRVSAETGLIFIQPRFSIFGLFAAAVGNYVFPPRMQVICGLICVILCIDQCQMLINFLVNALHLGSLSKISPKKIGATTALMYVVAVIIAFGVLLMTAYHFGGPVGMGWHYERLPTMAFRSALKNLLQLKALGLAEEADSLPFIQRISHALPYEHFLSAFIFGIVAVLVCSFLRLRLTWWPIHPVMFLLWAPFPIQTSTYSLLIGWLVKKLSIRLGGARIANKLKPMMTGIIAGEVTSAVLFLIVGFIYYYNTGKTPKPYSWFPR
jgi:hypothetical protein